MLKYFLSLVFYLIVLVTLALLYRAHRTSRRYLMKYVALGTSLFVAYAASETALTLWYRISWKGSSVWLLEDGGPTVLFDPIRGYRLAGVPARWARITDGVVEFVGTVRGNAQGFPSRNDFSRERPRDVSRRYAVFGDSFTAAQYLDHSWPERTQAVARERGEALELLNCSLDGGGLANWWSVLTRFVGPEKFEIDGVVFAVFVDDLDRKFSFSDERGCRHHMFGRWFSWDPASYPSSLEQAKPYLQDTSGYIVTRNEFDQFLQKRWPRSIARPPLRPVIASTLSKLMENWPSLEARPTPPTVSARLESGQRTLIEDMGRFLEDHHLPALVVYIPSRESLIGGGDGTWIVKTKRFAAALHAAFCDGRKAFANMTPVEIRKSFLPYDPHWNQAGSDRFAEFMVDTLQAFADPQGRQGT